MDDDLIPYEHAFDIKPSKQDDLIPYETAVGSSQPSGMLSRAPDEGYLSGLAKGATTATIQGLSALPGMFGNLRETSKALSGSVLEKMGVPREEIERNRRLYSGPADFLPTGEDISKPILGVTGAYEPESYLGKLGMTGLETSLSMLGPGGGAVKLGQRALSRALPAAERAVPKLGFEALKETAKMAPAGFFPGVAGQAAYDVTGDPLYAFGASILAGGAQPAAKRATEATFRPVLEDIPYFGRGYAGERGRMAGEVLQKTASQPEKVKETLFPESGPAPETIVEGSRPTLGQVTGDIGLLEAERTLRTKETEPFNILEAEQNAARVRALGTIPTAGAESMKVVDLVSRQSQQLNKSLEQAENALIQDAISKADKLGSQIAPEQLGQFLRNSIEEVRKDVQKNVSELYQAVDPEGTMALIATPVRDKVTNIVKNIDPYGSPINENETRIYGKITNMPDVLPFRSLIELDKDITQSMKEAKIAGQGISRERLIEAKTAVQDAINNAIEYQEAYEAAAVQRGEIAPEQTVEARVRDWVNQFQREKTGEAAPIESETLQPRMDEEAAARLREAKEAHKQYATTYRAEPIEGAIKTTGFEGQYKVLPGAVPGKAIVKGPTGFDTAKAFIKASKASPDAIFAMKESLLNDLRGRLKSGPLNTQKINSWKSDFNGALRALDEQVPGFSRSFDDAAKAADKLAEFGAQRKATEEAFQKQTLAKFLGATDATEVENRVAKILRNKESGVTEMRNLVSQVSKDPAALEGLRKATADWIVSNMTTTAEAATSGQKLLSAGNFQKMVSGTDSVLSQVFTKEQMNTLRAIAKDMERANRINQATRVAASPGSAKDWFKAVWNKVPETFKTTSLFAGMVAGLMKAYDAGGLQAVALIGVPLAAEEGFRHWRGTGMDKVQSLVKEGLLNPTIGRQLLMNVPTKQLSARKEIFGRALQKSLYQPSDVSGDKREEYAKGGKVYPAKKMSHMERAAAKAFNDIANETKPLMDVPDEHIAHALGMAAV